MTVASIAKGGAIGVVVILVLVVAAAAVPLVRNPQFVGRSMAGVAQGAAEILARAGGR